MSRISRLERRFGRFAIQNLTLFIIAGQAVLYVANLLPQGVALDRVVLDPALVMRGQVWRLFTFLFTPPAIDWIWAVFYFALLHHFGSTLEHYWGAFRYNVYILTGYLANVVAAFAGSAILGGQIAEALGDAPLKLASMPATNEFFYMSLFLAFARLFPDFIINLFFILPVRIKWLAALAWIGYALALVQGDWMVRMLVLATVANYLLFFGPQHARDLRQGRRRRSFQAKARRATSQVRHTCVVCGLSSETSPKTLFRYCSKCAGQQCYCPEHIHRHEHVTAGASGAL
ncbi:MAG: hypothetical protein DCC67_10495 [Planctomycetota bacterium]|nr:MAG: hypothetical protein DCC67_10495 [Planctomycetota bacterium]